MPNINTKYVFRMISFLNKNCSEFTLLTAVKYVGDFKTHMRYSRQTVNQQHIH